VFVTVIAVVVGVGAGRVTVTEGRSGSVAVVVVGSASVVAGTVGAGVVTWGRSGAVRVAVGRVAFVGTATLSPPPLPPHAAAHRTRNRANAAAGARRCVTTRRYETGALDTSSGSGEIALAPVSSSRGMRLPARTLKPL
jgi:hypothetical protein